MRPSAGTDRNGTSNRVRLLIATTAIWGIGIRAGRVEQLSGHLFPQRVKAACHAQRDGYDARAAHKSCCNKSTRQVRAPGNGPNLGKSPLSGTLDLGMGNSEFKGRGEVIPGHKAQSPWPRLRHFENQPKRSPSEPR